VDVACLPANITTSDLIERGKFLAPSVHVCRHCESNVEYDKVDT
jgi:hypothetical protein